jgi:hypothetical protein
MLFGFCFVRFPNLNFLCNISSNGTSHCRAREMYGHVKSYAMWENSFGNNAMWVPHGGN